MENKYRFEGDEKVIDLLAKSFAASLKRFKFEEKIHVIHPGSPHVYQYSLKDKMISLATSEEEGKCFLSLESEEEIPEFITIIGKAIIDLFNKVVVQLIRSVKPVSERKKIIGEIKNIIKKFE